MLRPNSSPQAAAATNALGQPVGFAVPNWQPCQLPGDQAMQGRLCQLEAFNARHVDDLYAAFCQDSTGHNWTYLPYGPFTSRADFAAWTQQTCGGGDPYFYSVIDSKTRQAVGMASYLRIDPTNGVIEVGHIHFSPLLQRTALATEALFLMMRRVFDELGYRRYEWKCDALNAPSKQAAARLGFSFEGVFRQALMYKQRNRDTAWFSILDREWPALRLSFEQWLDESNFDADGRQKKSLAAFRK